MITNETATQIAMIYREIEGSKEILLKVDEELKQEQERRGFHGEIEYTARTCKMEFPSNSDSYRVFRVEPKLAKSVIIAHLADQKAKLEKLNESARLEIEEPK